MEYKGLQGVGSGYSWNTPGLPLIILSFSHTLRSCTIKEAQRDRVYVDAENTERHSQLGFQLNTYDMDLSEYVFADD
jgi:hypothetical protein